MSVSVKSTAPVQGASFPTGTAASRAWTRQRGGVMGVALWALVALLWLAGAIAVLPSAAPLLVFVATFAVFTLPGWPLARWLLGARTSGLARLPFALLLGYATGSVVYLVLRLGGAANPAIFGLASLAITVVLSAWLIAGDDGLLSLPELDSRDAIALAGLLLVAGLIVAPVFAHVGKATPDGLAYRAYFIADLFAHMSVVAELVKGTAPAVNPYYAVEPLPYYWTFFTCPTLFAGLQPALTVDRGILLTDLVMAGAYVSVWYLALRSLGLSALACALAWGLVLAASSFEGAYFLGEQRATGAYGEFRYLNIDALTRWRWDLPPVDGMHRLLWYTPQHGFAVTLGLLALVVSGTPRTDRPLGRGVLEGALLAVALACSSFNGLILVASYGLGRAVLLGRDRFTAVGAWVTARAVAALLVVLALGLLIALGMIQRNAGEIIWGLNRHFLRGPWAFIALSFGAPLILAPFGIRALWRLAPRVVVLFASLALVCTVVFLMVDVRGHENTYVTFRTAQLGYVIGAALVAAAIDAARRWRRPARLAFVTAGLIATLVALPTVVLDAYNAQDITNVRMSVGGFPWTVHVTPGELTALAWLRANTRKTAIVQLEPVAHGRGTWALLPAFGERRMAVGLGLFEPNPRRFGPMMNEMRQLFRTLDGNEAMAICAKYRIEYLWIGSEEHGADGPGADKFRTDPEHFSVVYDADGVTIYRVRLTLAQLRGAA